MINVRAYEEKLRAGHPFTQDEVAQLLRAFEGVDKLAVHLADCHAATCESLPLATPKNRLTRMAQVALDAAKRLLWQEPQSVPYSRRPGVDEVKARCRDATALMRKQMAAAEARKIG